MIGSLRGTLLDRARDEVLVEVGGLGYRVLVSSRTSVGLGAVGDEVLLHVHHHVREDAQSLYGFPTVEDRRVFEVLLGAHGVGPALAQAILTALPADDLRRALAANDVDALCEVPGVGKKTAARLLLELGPRLGADSVPDLPDLTGASSGADGAPTAAHTDVREALVGLGYAPDEIRRAMSELPSDLDATELLRQALQRLAAA